MDLSGGSTASECPNITASAPQTMGDGVKIKRKSHTRSKYGGLLNSLAFLKPKDPVTRPPKMDDGELAQSAHGELTKDTSSPAAALHQSQGRQRKGSLRQAAMAKMRERSGSLRKELAAPIITTTVSADSLPHENTSPPGDYDNKATFPTPSGGHLSLDTQLETARTASRLIPHLLESPITSPVGLYASTTDEEDHVSFYRPASSSSAASFNVSSQGPALSLLRRRSKRGEQRVPASAVPTTPEIDLDEEWDYSETEWWGWAVLLATWIVFVVGMGSCLGVWSWAWDVGETPYAPPDLEDDDTLPITGYYPALMFCTAVMAWVWVVVAWVGMKYFRHAKVGVDG